jgi:hypothetical protein
MTLDIKRVKDTIPTESISVLVWGASKSGKTQFAGTAGDRSLFISNGLGSSTFHSPSFKNKVHSNPLIIEVPFDEVSNKQRSIAIVGKAVEFGLENDDVDTIIIDDASANTRSAMIRGMEYNDATNKSHTISSGKSYDNLTVPAVQDYGTEMEVTIQFYASVISDCKAKNKHFILLAHERNIFKASSKIGEQPTLIRQVPYFTGADKNPDRIPGLFDWVLHMEKKGGGERVKYMMRTQGDENLLADMRNARGLFPVLVEDPNFLNMVQKLKEYHESQK